MGFLSIGCEGCVWVHIMWDTQQVQCLSAPPKDSCVPSSSAVFSYYTPPLSPFKVGPHGFKVHSIRRFDWAAPPLHRVWETLGKDEEENAMILARALEPSIAFTSSTTSWFERVNFPQKVECSLSPQPILSFKSLGIVISQGGLKPLSIVASLGIGKETPSGFLCKWHNTLSWYTQFLRS
jgi:hypothetical protein